MIIELIGCLKTCIETYLLYLNIVKNWSENHEFCVIYVTQKIEFLI
jgi:hypothetical protein